MKTRFTLTDFITLKISKDEQTVSISYSEKNKENIYQYLYEHGVRSLRLTNKNHYLLFKQGKYTEISEWNCKDIIFSKIESLILESDNWKLTREALYRAKFSRIFSKPLQVLTGDVSDEDMHSISLIVDYEYKHDWEKEQTILFLNHNKFKSYYDGSGYSKRGNKHYYLETKTPNMYIIIELFYDNPKRQRYTFDCVLMEFPAKKNIGKLFPLSEKLITLDFRYKDHSHLLDDYLDNPLVII